MEEAQTLRTPVRKETLHPQKTTDSPRAEEAAVVEAAVDFLAAADPAADTPHVVDVTNAEPLRHQKKEAEKLETPSTCFPTLSLKSSASVLAPRLPKAHSATSSRHNKAPAARAEIRLPRTNNRWRAPRHPLLSLSLPAALRHLPGSHEAETPPVLLRLPPLLLEAEDPVRSLPLPPEKSSANA